MKVASVQINPLLGDFDYNAHLILSHVKKAKHCDLIVFPELSLFGYWPGALLERKSVVEQQLKALEKCHQKMPENTAVLIGAVTKNKKKHGKYYHNSAVLLKKHQKPRYFHKILLPTYDVFDELRYFEPGNIKNNLFQFKGYKILVTICADIWACTPHWEGMREDDDPLKSIKKGDVDFIVNLSASPFSKDKPIYRLKTIQRLTKRLSAPMLYTNLFGAQDEIIFDGGSVYVDKKGNVQMEAKYFKEDVQCCDLKELEDKTKKQKASKPISKITDPILFIKESLILGIKDFVRKAGYSHVHLGLSGGIDSALVASLAVEALGPQSVTAIAMPGPFSTKLSFSLAKKLAQNLDCHFKTLPIQDVYKHINQDLKTKHNISCMGITSENIQARLRALYLMAFANQNKSLLLAASNKSELAVGYATLYGDTSGALAPIGDVLKTEVYKIAEKYYSSWIPQEIISRPPTAELKKNQKDTDTLFEYSKIDESIDRLVVKCRPARNKVDRWLLQKLKESEFKKWQSPPILRISPHAFGSGRRYPINHFTNT